MVHGDVFRDLRDDVGVGFTDGLLAALASHLALLRVPRALVSSLEGQGTEEHCQVDELTELVNRFMTDLGATVSAGNVLVGDRLGLYRALAEADR